MNLNRGSNLFFEALMFVFDLGVAIKPKEPELEIFFKDRNGNGIPYKKGKALLVHEGYTFGFGSNRCHYTINSKKFLLLF